MKVSLAIAGPGRQDVVALELPRGATVAEALEAARGLAEFAGVAWDTFEVGVWSRPVATQTVLREGDRVELYRPLIADAKRQRRSRAGARAPKRPR